MTHTAELNHEATSTLAELAKAGAGYSELEDSFAAGAEAAAAAVSQAALSAGTSADLALVFATSKQDPDRLLEGVRSIVGSEMPIVGGYAVGAFTNDRLGYLGYQVGVAVLASPGMKVDVFTEEGLDKRGEREVGAALARRILATRFDGDPNIVLLYDSVKIPQTALNMATTILQGMTEVIGNWPAVAGVGVFGDMQFQPSRTWVGDTVLEQSATALVLSGGVRMDTIILHGCEPSGRYVTITKAEGPVVLEINGRPALQFLTEMLPDTPWEEYPLFVTLGVNKGDKFGPFREDDYANRMTMSVDKERGGLVMFEPDLITGSEVQLMRRSIDFGYIDRRIDELFSRLDPARRPFFALYIDCAGRASALCSTDGEEAEVVQAAFTARGIPLLGMYSGVEIAKFGQEVQALDWTGVLCVFSH
jgi:hypothetical protein